MKAIVGKFLVVCVGIAVFATVMAREIEQRSIRAPNGSLVRVGDPVSRVYAVYGTPNEREETDTTCEFRVMNGKDTFSCHNVHQLTYYHADAADGNHYRILLFAIDGRKVVQIKTTR